MPETKRMIVKITSTEWTRDDFEDAVARMKLVLEEVADAYNVLVEIEETAGDVGG